MRAVKMNHLGLALTAVMIWVVVGCGASAGGHDIANLDGTWHNPSNKEKVVISVTGEKKTITIADKTMPLTVKPAQADRFIFLVSDSASGEKEWKVFRVWDDTGNSFSLEIDHDGKKEKLERAKG
jgi:uncharacterized protein (DUF2147 family)